MSIILIFMLILLSGFYFFFLGRSREEDAQVEDEEEVVDPKPAIENSCKPRCVKQLLTYEVIGLQLFYFTLCGDQISRVSRARHNTRSLQVCDMIERFFVLGFRV